MPTVGNYVTDAFGMTKPTTRRGILMTAPGAVVAAGSASALNAASQGAVVSPTAEGADPSSRNFRAAGALGDGRTDDGPAIRRALGRLGMTGDSYRLTKGRYLVGGSGDSLLHLGAPINIEGDGTALSVLQPSNDASGRDAIHIAPNAEHDHSGLHLSKFAIHDPTNGRRIGRHGVVIDTRAGGRNLANIVIEDLIVGQGSGWAVLHLNDAARNPNGGLWASTISRCQLKGGIRLSDSGDSVRISDNILSGGNIGIDVALVAGASCMAVERCNITNSGGAIRHRRGNRTTYAGLNIENLQPGALEQNNGAVVMIAGEDMPIIGGCLVDSLVSAFGASNATHLVRLANTRGFTIDRLTLLTGLRRPVIALEIAESAYDTKVGSLQMQAGGVDGFAMRIIDNGVGTMGVFKLAALEAGWRRTPGVSSLGFLKGFDGMVRLWGTVAGEVAEGPRRITTLPPGFRPREPVHVPIIALSGDRAVSELAGIGSDGSVTVDKMDRADQISFNASFAAARLAHSETPE